MGLNRFTFSSRMKLFINPGFVDFYTIPVVEFGCHFLNFRVCFQRSPLTHFFQNHK